MPKLFLTNEGEENIPIFVDILLRHKVKEEFIFCIDNAKVHLKAVYVCNTKNSYA